MEQRVEGEKPEEENRYEMENSSWTCDWMRKEATAGRKGTRL
jgi:hypothetical protein